MPNEITEIIGIHQVEAEKLFAGGFMIDENYARQTCGWLDPEIIKDPKIKAVWRRILAGEQAHEATMCEQVFWEFEGYVAKVPSSLYLPGFANTISLDHYLLQSVDSLSAMFKAITDRDAERLRDLAQSIAQSSPVAADEIPSAVDIGLEFQVMLDNLEGRSVNTGISSLDTATGGLEKQTLSVIAARPSMGKSSLGIQLCKYLAEKERKKTILFSLEMNRKSVWARMACGELRIAWRDVRARRVTDSQIQQIKDKSSELMDRLEDRLMIDDTPNMSIDDIWRKVSRYRPALIVIDHLGLIATTEKDEVKALGQVSWGGKMIAKQFDIPVVTLYQLNRATEGRDNKRPVMSDIRGSGKIEENADNIFFLYRPDYYETAQETGKVVSDTEIIIAKFRDGIRNIQVRLKYHLDEQHFYPLDIRQRDAAGRGG